MISSRLPSEPLVLIGSHNAVQGRVSVICSTLRFEGKDVGYGIVVFRNRHPMPCHPNPFTQANEGDV